jgi:hypothetical protein
MSNEYAVLFGHLTHAAVLAGTLLIVATLAFVLEQAGRKLRNAGLSTCASTMYSVVAFTLFALDIAVLLAFAIHGVLGAVSGMQW